MGFRFSLEHANWLAHILQPSGPTPQLEGEYEARESLQQLLRAARHDFYGSPHFRHEFLYAIERVEHDIGRGRPTPEALLYLRAFFRDMPWIALLIPSRDREFNRFFSSRDLLEGLVNIRPGDPGLILQLQDAPMDRMPIELRNVFPAFRVALAHATSWPGVLVWTPSGDAAFFEVPESRNRARSCLEWLFSHLAVTYGFPDLALLSEQYARANLAGDARDTVPLRMLHVSDLHLGSRTAQQRLPRVKQLIQQLAAELGEYAPVVPVVTGDLMDTPDDTHLDAARDFVEFLHSVGSEEPVFVLGNHDVRRDGWLNPELQNALRIQTDRARWFDHCQVGLACFNSVRGGHLARGRIDETELMDVGLALDREPEKAASYVLASLLHHHPIPVERPPWYRQEWYDRFLGGAFERTVALEGSTQFLAWLRQRHIAVALHGHKHIPRMDEHDAMLVVGCGSSVGKVQTQEGGTSYMSMNVITIDATRRRLACRLMAERIPGAGMTAEDQCEVVLTAPVPSWDGPAQQRDPADNAPHDM